MDDQPAAVDFLVRLRLGVPLLLHQVFFEPVGQGINKIRGKAVRDLIIDDLYALVHIILYSLGILLVRNVAVVEHIMQNLQTALGVLLGIADRVIAGRVLRDTGDHGALGQR